MSNNRNKNKGKKQPQKYTGKNIDFMGDPGRMEKHAIDVFRDMSHGRYNFNNLIEFENRDFVYSAIKAAEKSYRKHDILLTALRYTYGLSTDSDVVGLINIEQTCCNSWNFIVNAMYAFMNTRDYGSLIGMAQQLSSNRNLRL